LAIFIRATARVFRAPARLVSGSWPARAANLLGAVMNGRPDSDQTGAILEAAKKELREILELLK